MKKSLSLKDSRSALVSKLEDVHTKATSEKRELSKIEGKNVDNYLSKIDALDVSIKRAEKIEAELRANVSVAGAPVQTIKADKRYSIQNAIAGMVNGNLSGIEKEYDQEARLNNTITGLGIPTFAMGETRNNPQTTANASGMIPTEVGDWAETLQQRTVLGDLATWMYGLSGDMKLPTLSGTVAGWSAEGAAANSANTAIGSGTLQPKRLDATMDISKMLLAQTNGSVENIIRTDMNNAIASTLEAAVLGQNAGAGNVPEGVFNAGIATATGAMAYSTLLDMEAALAASGADFGRLAYLTTPNGRALLKNIIGQPLAGTAAAGLTNGQPIWSEDLVDGYMARSTGNVDSIAGANPNGIVLGRWDDCVIGNFGTALDVVVDPYTQAINGEVRITILSYWDTLFRRADSFQYTYY